MKVMDDGTSDCKFTDPRYSLRMLHELLNGEFGETRAEWHVRITYQYLKSLPPEGIPAEDLQNLIFILESLSKKLDYVAEYKMAFAELLKKSCSITETLATSFLKRNFDISILEKYFSFLGCLLVTIFNDDKILDTAIDVTEHWVQICYSTSSDCTIGSLCQLAMENSCLPLTLSRALDTVSRPAYFKLLNIAFQMINGSPECCEVMASMGVINVILMRLNVNLISFTDFPPIEKSHLKNVNFKREELPFMALSISFLLTMLSSIKGTETLEKDTEAPTRKALCNLRYLMRVFLSQKPTRRNNAFVLLLMILTSFPKIKIVESGLVEDIAVLAKSEMGNAWIDSEDNTQFRRIILLCLSHCCKFSAALAIFKTYKVVKVIINFVNISESEGNMDTQTWDMKLTVLDTLNHIVPYLYEDFIEGKGSALLLATIINFLKKSYEPIILCKSMKILHTVAKYEPLLSDLREHDSMRIIIELCEHILIHFHLTQIFQKILAYGFYILEKLTNNNITDEGATISIDIILNMLIRLVKPNMRDSCLDNRLLICLCDFIWTYVVWNPKNFKYFAMNGGIYAILDAFNICIRPAKLLLLSIIVDMCEEGTALQHLLTWRNRKCKKEFLIKLLVNLWKEEETSRKVKRKNNNVIKDIEYPLMGENQRMSKPTSGKISSSSPAIADTVGSMRPKIYAVIQLLSRHSDVKKAILEQYGMFYLELQPEDKVILEVIKNYLAFKLGEIWNEVYESVSASCLEPIGVDKNLLKRLSEKYCKWGTAVQKVQLSIIKQAEDKECDKEADLYVLLKEARLADSLEALRELELIARSTDNEFRLKRKQMQNDQINKSLLSLNLDNKHIHRTYNENINVTQITQQHMVVPPK